VRLIGLLLEFLLLGLGFGLMLLNFVDKPTDSVEQK
jgi:hypothetical protein